MRGLDTLNARPQAQETIDVDAFWGRLEPLLRERNIDPMDHIRETVIGAEDEIWQMPDSLFDPLGDEASHLKRAHLELRLHIDEPMAYSSGVAREIFPYWVKQLKDARDWLGTI